MSCSMLVYRLCAVHARNRNPAATLQAINILSVGRCNSNTGQEVSGHWNLLLMFKV